MQPPTVPCPERIAPQLVTLVSRPPAGAWRYEIKYDGYRMLARIDGSVQLFTKNGYDWTDRMPLLAADLARLAVHSAWLDGEMVVQDDDGRPAFQALQSAFATRNTDHLVYVVFDLLYLNGVDLRGEPVEQRRKALADLLDDCPLDRVRLSDTLDADPAQLLANACRLKLEGIVGKRDGSRYSGERDGSWVKLKCGNRQEFIIVGYTRSSAGIGSLLLGLHDDDGRLVYAGRVKSGFSGRALDDLRSRLGPLVQATPVLAHPPKLEKGLTVVWVAPEQVCEVKFSEITPSGKVRHAVFVALRDDKPAAGISLESDMEPQ
ncbi:non-homologous end-joining DNA ligase [Pseudomonas sp. KCA11]|uniref:non-homologous end-joining DNA ligase n=1 Tax=Pseudomonas sp. KCA11 TaxID=2899114 RepID=UPI001F44905F|nr:non-homologous end-joining DNA ligase [Pseudomonas sp. KCA11]MCE5993290.1 non-homologous end-joining DNA ligase [Pseudomonas sp. KCA11]